MSERKTKTKRTDRTKRTSPTKRSSPTKRITHTKRTLTKNLEVLDYGAGEIETDEFAQVGLTKKGRLTNKAPIEAVSGVNAPKGKSLRRKGIKNVGHLRKKKTPVTLEASSLDELRQLAKVYDVEYRGVTKPVLQKRIAKKMNEVLTSEDNSQFSQREIYEASVAQKYEKMYPREVQAKEDAKLQYFIYHLDSNNLLVEPYSSRKEAKDKIAFIKTKRKGDYHIITAESADKATEKSKQLPEYQAALKAEEDYEKELRANLQDSKIDKLKDRVRSEEFNQAFHKDPDLAELMLKTDIMNLSDKEKKEFATWMVKELEKGTFDDRANLTPDSKVKKVSKIDIDRKTVQNAIKFTRTQTFREMYKEEPEEAMHLLNQQLSEVDPSARDEFDEWFVDMDKEGEFEPNRSKMQRQNDKFMEERRAARQKEDNRQLRVKSNLPRSESGYLIQEGKELDPKGGFYVFQEEDAEAMMFYDLAQAQNYKTDLEKPSIIVSGNDFADSYDKAKTRLARNKAIDAEIAQQKAINRKIAAEDRKLRSADIKKRKDETAGRDLHSTHAQDFELGEIYYYRWTNNFNQYEGKVKIIKINPKSVRIQLLDPPKGYKKGQNWNVRLVEQTKNNGLYPLSSEEISQVQDVASSQVNIRVLDSNYKDRREFRKLGLVPERDADGKFLAWRGNVDPEDIPKLEALGTVEHTKQAYTQEEVHMDEIARLNRQLDALEEREFKKSKQHDDLSTEIKVLADMIPLGEPIKVGHHSEKRHRKHFEKIDNKERKRYELRQEILKIQSQKESIERRKKAMLGRKEKEYIKPTPQSYIAANPELKRELDHAIDKLPKEKADAYKQQETAKKVREKLDSKKSWNKTEIRDLLLSNNIYVDLENVSGKENWIAEANKAIDNSISNQRREIKNIDDFNFYVKDDTVERRLFFVTDNAVMYRANREQRIANMENQMEFWQLTKQKIEKAKTPEEVAHTEKHYFERMKVLHDESIKLDKQKTSLDTRFFTDIRELPSGLSGKIAYTATNDFAADSFLVKQRNDDRWKAIPHESNAKQIFKDHKQAVTKAQQKERVENVKQAVQQKKLEPDDPKTVVAFETEKNTWVLLPDGRYVRSSDRAERGFVYVSQNEFLKAMKNEDLKSIHQAKDFQDEDEGVRADQKDADRWFASWALVHGWGIDSYNKFQTNPEITGVMMDRARVMALVNETRATGIDLSVHEGNYMEPKPFGKPKVIKYKNDNNEDAEAYQIRKDLHYDKEFVDIALAFATKNKKDFPNVLVKIPNTQKPIMVYVDDFVGIIIAPTGVKDVDLEDYPVGDDLDDDDFTPEHELQLSPAEIKEWEEIQAKRDAEREESGYTTESYQQKFGGLSKLSIGSKGAFSGSDKVDPKELADRIAREL